MRFTSAFLCGMMLALAAARYDEGSMGLAWINLVFAAAYAIWYRARFALQGADKP